MFMKNSHAFFPLLTFLKSSIRIIIPYEMTELIIGIVLPYFMYKFTRTIFSSESFAYYSSIFMALNYCTRFYISYYTEGVFTLISLIGFSVLFKNYSKDWMNRISYTKIVVSSILLSINVYWRSNGLFLAVVPGIFILYKLYLNRYSIVNSLLIVLLGVFVLAIFITPFIMITRIIPYNMYWSNSIHDTQLSEWWYYRDPDLYSYIQKVYWKSGFLQQFKRGFHSSYFESLPINLFNIYIIKEILQWLKIKFNNTENECSVIKSKRKEFDKYKISQISLIQPEFISLYIHYVISIIFINLFANLEIMMRVSSTHPVHYWGTIYLISKQNKSKFEQLLKIILVLFNAIEFFFQMTAFPLHVGTP